jgi:hypothetical protein
MACCHFLLPPTDASVLESFRRDLPNAITRKQTPAKVEAGTRTSADQSAVAASETGEQVDRGGTRARFPPVDRPRGVVGRVSHGWLPDSAAISGNKEEG